MLLKTLWLFLKCHLIKPLLLVVNFFVVYTETTFTYIVSIYLNTGQVLQQLALFADSK